MTTGKIQYNKHIDHYSKQVESGHIVASKEVKQLVAYLKGKLHDEKELIHIDHEEIDRAIKAIERYFPFLLLP